MTSSSPTVEGFRLLFRRPMIPAAEIAWRWAFGGALWFLAALLLVEYASSLTVDAGTGLLLRSGQPALVWRALRHLFSGTGMRFAGLVVVVTLALVIFWMAAASLGQLATLKALGEEFKVAEEPSGGCSSPLRSLLALNFLRAAASLATVVAAVGGLIAANSIWAHSQASVADAARLWFASGCLIGLSWAVVNWFLATGSVFVVSRRSPAFAALRALAAFCQEQLGAIIVIGIWFGLAHVASLILACASGFTALSLLTRLGMAPVMLVESLIAILYFAIADFLYAGRLAAYLALLSGRGIIHAGGSELPGGPAGRIDQSELILSDLPV